MFHRPARSDASRRAEPGALEKPVEAVASNDLRKSATYQPVEGGIARVNGPNFYNRPLYCNGIPVQVLAGDLPSFRISSNDYVLGHFLAAYVRGDSVIGLQDFAQKEAIFRYGLFEWRLEDDRLGGTKVVCEVVPTAEGAGFAVRVRAEGSQPGDRLIWLYGGARRPEGMPAIYANVSWFFDPVFLSNAADLRTAFRPDACAGNEIALEMHLDWSRACFDPDGDGCYESYINTWLTDSVWYNGGGSVEESAYIYRGRMAAADMARRAGDDSSAKAHLAEAEKICRGMMKGLWDADRGHCGVYREQGGHQRLHTDACVRMSL